MAEDKDNKIEDNQEKENQKTQDQQDKTTKNSQEPDNKEGKKNSSKGADKKVDISGKFEGAVGEANFAERMYMFEEFKQIIFEEGKGLKFKEFTLSYAHVVAKENINSLKTFFVYPEDELTDLIESLTSKRILFLAGDSESGKYLTAKYLSFWMIKQNEKEYEVRWVEPLAREVNVELMELIKNPKALKEKILIFRNVFFKKNQNLMDFLISCSREQLDLIFKKLSELDSYILFTADTGTFHQYQLSHLEIKKDIFSLDQKLLQKGFDLILRHFCSLSDKRDFQKASELLEGKKQEIIDKLKRMSKIDFFIKNYLERMLFEEKSIDEAIEEVNNIKKHLEYWFLKDLGENKEEFEAWTFALCLVMFNYSSYADFNEIHRKITRIFLRELNPFNTKKDFAFILSENELLAKCRARICKDIITNADIIEFCDPGYQEVLMEVLLENNRKALLNIIPFLEKYVESQDRPDLRRLAASCLGRIGVLDPDAITLRLIDKWANMQSNLHRVNVGYLYEGIITSKDESYLSYCVRELRTMALSNDIDEQWTAIAAYKQIGLYGLEFAMEELRKIQEEIVERMFEKENVLDIIYSQTNLLSEHEAFVNLEQIYKETNYLLSNVRYTIIALAVITHPIDVLSQLRKWIDKGNRNSRKSVVLFFIGIEHLKIEGIIQVLEDRQIIYYSDEEEEKKEKLHSNALLYALTAGDEPVKKMADFLKDLYQKCFSEFPMDSNNALKTILFRHLEKWAVDSLFNSSANNALKQLIVQLYHSGDDELKDTLWDSINRWKAPKKKEEKLITFVDEVTKQIFDM